MSVVSLAELLESGVHFGHQTRRWNPKMANYIFTDRNGVHIIDLVQTARLLEKVYSDVRDASEKGQKVLFVGTKRQAAAIIAQEASRCGAYYINQRWLGGMLTNWETIKSRVERLKELEKLENDGAINKRPKKEASVMRRELSKLQKYLGGIKSMRKLPDIVVIVDQRREYNAILECQKLNIPIVSLLDTNCDPDCVDLPIPANDDAIRSIKLIVSKLADAIYEGNHGAPMNDDFNYEDYDDYEDDIPDAVAEVDEAEATTNEESVEVIQMVETPETPQTVATEESEAAVVTETEAEAEAEPDSMATEAVETADAIEEVTEAVAEEVVAPEETSIPEAAELDEAEPEIKTEVEG